MQDLNKAKFFHFFEKSEFWLYLIAVVCCLIPIWCITWFASQDGPSHLHNSKVLLDFWQGNHADFYSCCYERDASWFPNWTDHFVFANLMRFFSPWLTEKIWLTAYVLVFASFFRLLITELNPENRFLALLVLPFLFMKPLQMGFYNFTFSVALLPGCFYLWLRFDKDKTLFKALALCLFLLLLYFTHLIGLLLALGMIFSFFTGKFILQSYAGKSLKSSAREFFAAGLPLLAITLPTLVLTCIFLSGGEAKPSQGSEPVSLLLQKFINLDMLVNYTKREYLWANVLGVLLAVISALNIYYRIRQRRLLPGDAFLFLALFVFTIYLLQPAPISGKEIFPIRLQGLPWLFLILWLALTQFPKTIRVFYSFASFIVILGFTLIRLPEQQKISNGFDEIARAGKYIPERSRVLYLSFNHNGAVDEVKTLSPLYWAFMHSADYLGAEKSLVMLGNYEASNLHFPVHYVDKMNPYQIMKERGGFENQPPYADFMEYSRRTGLSVDYILTWCLDQTYPSDPTVNEMRKMLKDHGERIYSSANGRAVLFKIRD